MHGADQPSLGTPRRAFAERQGVVPRVAVVSQRDSMLGLLEEGVGDVAAGRFVADTVDNRHVAFTRHLYQTSPALVRRHGPPGSTALPEPVDTLLAGGPLDDGALDADAPPASNARQPPELRARSSPGRGSSLATPCTSPAAPPISTPWWSSKIGSRATSRWWRWAPTPPSRHSSAAWRAWSLS